MHRLVASIQHVLVHELSPAGEVDLQCDVLQVRQGIVEVTAMDDAAIVSLCHNRCAG